MTLIEYKNFRFEHKILDDEPRGTFEGMASIFGNVDLDRDVVEKGAFTKSLKRMLAEGRKLKMFRGHQIPIGTFDVVKEVDLGLFVKGRPLIEEVQKAAETAALMKSGALDGLSIGYAVLEKEIDNEGVRHLKELELMEVSVVPFGANPEALVTDVKSLATAEEIASLTGVRECEVFLRDVGFSQTQAKSLISRIKALSDHRDDVEEVSLGDIAELLSNITESLNNSR
jgi:hypothetical protein